MRWLEFGVALLCAAFCILSCYTHSTCLYSESLPVNVDSTYYAKLMRTYTKCLEFQLIDESNKSVFLVCIIRSYVYLIYICVSVTLYNILLTLINKYDTFITPSVYIFSVPEGFYNPRISTQLILIHTYHVHCQYTCGSMA